jgi:hypothetical protein
MQCTGNVAQCDCALLHNHAYTHNVLFPSTHDVQLIHRHYGSCSMQICFQGKPASKPSPPPSHVTPADKTVVGNAVDANAPELVASAVPATILSSNAVIHAFFFPPRVTGLASGHEGWYPMEESSSDDDSEYEVQSDSSDQKRCNDCHANVFSDDSDSTVSSRRLYSYSLPKPLLSCLWKDVNGKIKLTWYAPSGVEMEVGSL